ncbi:MAG: response regulator [Acetobacteraceae bacterium]|jgi:two-component system response regulator FixJ
MNDNNPGIVGIVDDDPAVLDSLKFLLEVVGYQVSTYASADAFLGDGATAPACLIIDQHMPGMTGLEMAQKLRDDGDAIPILLITGSPSPAIVARAAQLGIVNVLEKPPEEADLLNFVGAYI